MNWNYTRTFFFYITGTDLCSVAAAAGSGIQTSLVLDIDMDNGLRAIQGIRGVDMSLYISRGSGVLGELHVQCSRHCLVTCHFFRNSRDLSGCF
jgi:hypothetical protein